MTFYFLRRSRSQLLFKIGALKNLDKITGKHLSWRLLFNKVVQLY